MQSHYAAHFTREQGCTEQDWLRWLPGAVRDCALSLPAPGQALVHITAPGSPGWLHLGWQVLPPRQIALVRMPRMAIDYRFEGLDDTARQAFMRYFDLYMQRGGG